MKKLVSLLMATVMVMMLFVGCGSDEQTPSNAGSQNEATAEATQESTESITLKLGHKAPLDNELNLISERFKELVEDRTEGRVLIEIYPQGQLGNDRDLIEAMQFGTVDMSVSITAVYSNFEPKIGTLDLPYLFEDWDHMMAFVDSDVSLELLGELEDEGIIGLALKANGFRNVTNSVRPIETPEDLGGVKMRVLESPVFVKTFEDLGAVVSAMSWGEVYTALQQGAIDGQETPPEVIYTEKVFEVQDYMSKTEHITSFTAIGIGQISLDKLSEGDQEIVKECARQTASEMTASARDKEAGFIQKLQDEGMMVNEVNKEPFKALTTSAYDWFANECGTDYVDKINALK